MARRPANGSYEALQQLIQGPTVRAKLDEVAHRIAGRAAGLAQQEGVEVPVTTKGTRPKGRSFARVEIPASHEFGDEKTKRLRLLSRAVRGS